MKKQEIMKPTDEKGTKIKEETNNLIEEEMAVEN